MFRFRCKCTCSNSHLVKEISDPFGDHKDKHYRNAKADVSSRFHQNNSQTDCHSDNTTCKARKEQKTVRQLIAKHASWSAVNRREAVFRKAQARKVLCMPYGKKMWYYCGYTLQMHFFYIGLVRDFDWLQSWQPRDLIHSVEYTRRKYSARSSDETFRRMLEDSPSGVPSGIIDDRAWTAGRTTSYSTFTAESLTQMEHKRATEQERATKNDDVNNHIAEHHLQTGRNIKSIATLRQCITYFTGYYQRLTN